MDYIVHGILQARILEWGSLSLLQGIFLIQGSNPGLTLQADSIPVEPPRKPIRKTKKDLYHVTLPVLSSRIGELKCHTANTK